MGTLDQTQGCLLGLSLGDAYGAPYEGGFLERSLWRVIGSTRGGEKRWTDDTQMSIDVIESFLATGRIDPDDLAMRFSNSYRWSRGYGPGAARVLRRIAAGSDWREASRAVYANGSFGNGAAMRAPMIGVIYSHNRAELHEAACCSAVVTHAHPLGVEGAVLIARVTASVFRGEKSRDVLEEGLSVVSHDEFRSRLIVAREWLESGRDASIKDVVRQLGNGIAAHESCVTAVYVAMRFRDQSFELMHEFIASCGGDADTIGAMAGAIWGAANGSQRLPEPWLEKLEQRERLCELGTSLHRQVDERTTNKANDGEQRDT